jgi:hypothetical protein
VFEYWADEFSAPLRRVVDPPAPVLVDLATAIPTDGPFRRDTLSLRIKAGGLNVAATVPGLLYAWARTNDGTWLGLVAFTIHTGNGHGRVEARQWCPARAITRRR